MNIRDIIYYSPNVKMEALDFDNEERLLFAFHDRIENFYFKPINVFGKIELHKTAIKKYITRQLRRHCHQQLE